MLSKENIINLEDYRAKTNQTEAKLFTGRDRGLDVREKSNIDKIEEQYDKIIFIIPNNIFSINPSFFEELFKNVVIKLGRDGFYQKFEFRSEGGYPYERNLSEAIQRILRTKTAIG